MDEILKIPVIVHRCESDLAKERGGHTCLAFRAASLARLAAAGRLGKKLG